MSAVARPRRRVIAVDVRAALHAVATITAWLSATLVAPALVALWYGDSIAPFAWSIALGGGLAVVVARATRTSRPVGVREGVLIVALAWIAAAALGSLPYIFEGGDIDRPIDAYFEAMSGFTTTGSSAMADIESHSRAILFWRSLTQWLGGMGIIVAALAILPRLSLSGRVLMESESPGPEFEKLAPRIRSTATRLWGLYVAFTLAEIVLLCIVGYGGLSDGMDLYMAVTHSFTTMATGGFSPNARSLETFGAWAQWICLIFMVIAGVNFALWWRVFFRTPRWLRRDDEFRLYLGILLVASAAFSLDLYLSDGFDLHDSVRHATFTVVSTMTTTGAASTDDALWPGVLLFGLVVLMFIGGCAGSTGGAIKVVRIQIVMRTLRRDVRTSAHPEAVMPVRQNGRPLEERAVRAALVFTVIYVLIWLAGVAALLIAAEINGFPLTPFEAVGAAATTIGNVGPAFGFAGPMGSFAPFDDFSTVVMTLLMWIGRLELFPALVLLTRWYWRR